VADAELVVLLEGNYLGMLRQGRGGALQLNYDDDYRQDPDSTPLSTSMPTTAGSYRGRLVRAYLQGLLPDNGDVLTRWGRQFGVSPNNPFALLSHIGEDVAGAVQFVHPDRIDGLSPGGVEWLADEDIEAWIRAIREDPAAWLADANGHGHFSLAGAQSKFALHRDPATGRWGRPYGAVPTTHIMKPATVRADMEIDEHICLSAARRSGLTVAQSEILTFGAERVVAVERYDRVITEEGWQRVHQEDCCQALGLEPDKKYQSDGGPSPADIARLFWTVMPADVAAVAVAEFVDALAFNWLIGGTDAHAKNYSLLLSGRQVRFAPLYDLTSAFPYLVEAPVKRIPGQLTSSSISMAMKIGSTAKFGDVTRADWTSLANRAELEPAEVLDRVQKLIEQVPESVAAAAAEPEVAGLNSPLPERLVERVDRNVERCRNALAGRPPVGRPRRRSSPTSS
jgi:serine/threonine-protein kinase HipA